MLLSFSVILVNIKNNNNNNKHLILGECGEEGLSQTSGLNLKELSSSEEGYLLKTSKNVQAL